MARQRLHPLRSLRKPSDFQVVFKTGMFVKGSLLNLWICENEGWSGEAAPRLGIIINKKTSPRATQRNLWKRRIREAFRHLRHRIKDRVAVVIQSRKQNAVPSYREIEIEVEKLLAKTQGLK